MKKEKKIFSFLSLMMVGMLFIGAGLVFAAGDSSGGESDSLEEATEGLREKVMGQPGIIGVHEETRLEEGGVILVYVESKQAVEWLPDYFEGFPVWIAYGGPLLMIVAEPIESWRTDNQPGRVKTFTASTPRPSAWGTQPEGAAKTGLWSSSEGDIFRSTGNVGIGTISPGALLDVAGRISVTNTGNSVFIGEGAGANDDLSNNRNVFIGTDAGYSNTTGSANTIVGANVGGLPSDLSNNIIIADGEGNRRINVDSSGNVGIGTTEPQAKLHVNAVMRLEPQSNAPSGGLGDLYVSTDSKLSFHDGTDWREVQLD